MKNFFTLLFFISCNLTMNAQVKVADRPIKGNWDFNPKKVWEAETANQESFEMIAELRVLNEVLTLRDFMKGKSHIFDIKGKYISSIATEGSEKGQVSRYLNAFDGCGHIVIGAPEMLHFYSPNGEYLESYPNNLFVSFPLHFVDRTHFLYANQNPSLFPDQKAGVVKKDLKTQEVVPFGDFPVRAAKPASGPSFIVLGLTPQFKTAHDPKTGRFYSGWTDEYQIRISDKEGKQIGCFGIDRRRVPFSEEEKKNNFPLPQLTDEQRENFLVSLPDSLVSFFKIQFVRDHVFVFTIQKFGYEQSVQFIDIFSMDGEYLYRGVIKFPDGLMFKHPDNLVFSDETLYAIQYWEGGAKKSIAKYQISIPE